MCEAIVYRGEIREENILLKDVVYIEIKGDSALLKSIDGEEKHVEGFEKVVIDNLNHYLLFK